MISVADQLWEPDGTQPPPPPRVWDDPVAGLVAGERFDDEQFVVDVVEPVMPDMSEVRRAVDAVLSDEPPVVPAPRPQPVDAKAVPHRMPPPNPRPGWPRPPSVRQLPGRKRQIPGPRRPPPVQRVRKVKQPAGARGIATVAGTLVVIAIILVIVIMIISGLAHTISDLFG
jgi:hypothetical protein